MPFAEIENGVRIHYSVVEPAAPSGAEAGRDQAPRTVVLVQGLGLSSRFWFDLPERLGADARIAARVVTLDNRGTGRSDKPRGPYRMARLADDVVAVLDALRIASADVVGISLGGMIAQHVALRHPDRVSGLVLLATSPGLPHARLASPRILAALVSLAFSPRGKPSQALPMLLLPKTQHHRVHELFAGWAEAAREDSPELGPFFAQLTAASLHSTGFRLGKLRVPTVVVTGAEDVLIPPRNSEILAQKIAGAVLEVIPDVGHAIPMLDADVVARALLRLRDLERQVNAAAGDVARAV